MCSNALWNKDIDSWRNDISRWFSEPRRSFRLLTLLLDFRFVCGERSLFDELKEHVKKQINDNAIKVLAFDSTNFSALTSKERTCIKKSIIFPVSDMIRVLYIRHDVEETSTMKRAQRLVEYGDIDEDFKNEILEAYAFAQLLKESRECVALNQTDDVHEKVMKAVKVVEKLKEFVVEKLLK
jgi:Predicted signal-transduction protein containing cAMP-binding and CBS domains